MDTTAAAETDYEIRARIQSIMKDFVNPKNEKDIRHLNEEEKRWKLDESKEPIPRVSAKKKKDKKLVRGSNSPMNTSTYRQRTTMEE